jgi:hypothetical protein
MKDTLANMKVLQESQVKIIQQKLAQAGYRNKELAVFVIFARMALPIVLGFVGVVALYWLEMFPDWGSMKRFSAFAALVVAGYKGPELFLKNKSKKRTDAIRKGLPDALDLLVICAEAGLTVDAAVQPRRQGARPRLSRARRRVRADRDRAVVPHRAPPGVRELRLPRRPRRGARRGHDHDPDRALRHPAGLGAARALGRVPQRAHDARRGKGRAPAGDHDRAADPVHPAGAVHRHPRPGGLRHQRRLLGRRPDPG